MWDIHERELVNKPKKPIKAIKNRTYNANQYADYITRQTDHLEELQECRKGGDLA